MTTAPGAPPALAQLTVAQDLFIRRWGEMGATWGINRTMAERMYRASRPWASPSTDLAMSPPP